MNTTIISEGSQAKNKENHNKQDFQKLLTLQFNNDDTGCCRQQFLSGELKQ